MGMAKKDKRNKTNAMRILERTGVDFRVETYECEDFIDGIHLADQLGQSYEQSFKTLVMQGKSREYYVFVVPIAEEVDLKKAAKVVGEKSLEMVPVKEINAVTGYIRGGCTAIGMKKQYDTVIHNSAKDFEQIIVSGGKLGTQIFLAPDDLCRVTGGRFADIL